MTYDNAQNQQQADQALWGISSPDWEAWKTVQRARLWQAVALLCDIEPKTLESTFFPGKLDTIFCGSKTPPKFTNLLERAKNSLGTDSLRPVSLNDDCPEDSEISLSTFATWARSIGRNLPPSFPWEPDLTFPITGWPWGSYSTPELQKLAQAADKFWKRYDPTDSTTAPKNQEVIKWLIGQGISKNIAEAIATILRDKSLPTRSKKE